MNVSTHTTISNVDSDAGVSTGDMSTVGARSDHRSAMSVSQIGASTLSMRAKAARKRKVTAQHNSNFRAGYVPVEEDALHRTGIRGRKRYFLYCAVVFLMILAVLNTMITAWLLYVLGMTYQGMTSMELTSLGGRGFLRVLADARIITMSFNDAPLGARYNSTLILETKEMPLEIKSTTSESGSSIKLDETNMTLVTEEFSIKVKGKDDLLLSNLSSLAAHNSISNLYADNITAAMIRETKDFRDLYVESDQEMVQITAFEALNITSKKNIEVHAANISMNVKDSVVMGAKHGVYFAGLPVITTLDPINQDLLTYKLCICRSGEIFSVPVTRPGVSCDIRQQLQTVCGSSV